MFKRFLSDQWLGLFFFAFALILLFIWIPLDIETGIVETVRRRATIGDSLGPTVAGCVLLIGAVLVFLRPEKDAQTIISENISWVLWLLGIVAISICVMRYAGPLAANAFSDETYRALRSTPPWSYIGFVLGGGLLVYGLTGIAASSWHPRYLLIGVLSALTIALLYDLPFEDLLLPPNGDV